MSVIDLAAKVPYVREHVSVGDAPEGVAFNPQGTLAAITILQGSYDALSSAWFRKDVGKATLLQISKGKVSIVNSVDVGAFPEGIAFASNRQHIYVGTRCSFFLIGTGCSSMSIARRAPGSPAISMGIDAPDGYLEARFQVIAISAPDS